MPSPDAYPNDGEYREAIQNPRYAFRDSDLAAAQADTDPLGLPKVSSGGFALSFYLSQVGGQRYVVRCFKANMPARQQRYTVISSYLAGHRETYLLPVTYLEQGIKVDGRFYPVVKMPRVDGTTLGLFIEQNVTTPQNLQFLPSAFQQVVGSLQKLGIAHGDLQHGNIMVTAKKQLILIDYDGMYLPQLQGLPPNERGHRNYQHPGRNAQYDAKLDHFSSIAIYVALKAIATRPDLLLIQDRRYFDSEYILTKEQDFLEPDRSPLFSELETIPELRTYVQHLRHLCRLPYDAVPDLFTFLNGQIPHITSGQRAPTASPRSAHAIVDAADRDRLLHRAGDIVTVIGKITAVKSSVTRYGSPYLFLNFGDHRQGCLTLVIWSEVLDMFHQQQRDPSDLHNQWVTITGLVRTYVPSQAGRKTTPQIIIEQPSQVRVLRGGQAEAADLLAGRPPVPQPQRPLPAPAGAAATIRHLTAPTSTTPGPASVPRPIAPLLPPATRQPLPSAPTAPNPPAPPSVPAAPTATPPATGLPDWINSASAVPRNSSSTATTRAASPTPSPAATVQAQPAAQRPPAQPPGAPTGWPTDTPAPTPAPSPSVGQLPAIVIAIIFTGLFVLVGIFWYFTVRHSSPAGTPPIPAQASRPTVTAAAAATRANPTVPAAATVQAVTVDSPVPTAAATVTPLPPPTPTKVTSAEEPTVAPPTIDAATLPLSVPPGAATFKTTVNLLAAPGDTFDVVGLGAAGRPAAVTGIMRDGRWLRLAGGAWVETAYVTGIPADPTATAVPTAVQATEDGGATAATAAAADATPAPAAALLPTQTITGYVVVQAKALYVRANPSMQAMTTTVLLQSDCLPALAVQGPWIQVRLPNGSTGWSGRSHLALVSECPIPSPDAGPSPSSTQPSQ